MMQLMTQTAMLAGCPFQQPHAQTMSAEGQRQQGLSAGGDGDSRGGGDGGAAGAGSAQPQPPSATRRADRRSFADATRASAAAVAGGAVAGGVAAWGLLRPKAKGGRAQNPSMPLVPPHAVRRTERRAVSGLHAVETCMRWVCSYCRD